MKNINEQINHKLTLQFEDYYFESNRTSQVKYGFNCLPWSELALKFKLQIHIYFNRPVDVQLQNIL